MHVFYTPDIQKSNELPEEKHNTVPVFCGWVSETKSRLRTVRVTSTS